jgi:hypothetical protein
VGCTDTAGTKVCYCNTDLCNKSGGVRTRDVDVLALTAITLASFILSFKLL